MNFTNNTDAAKLQLKEIANNRILGNVSGDSEVPTALTKANVLSMINVADGAQVNVGTDLGSTTAAGQITITSSTGNNVTIVEASDTIAGLMSVTHHDKLDGIEASADVTDTVNVKAALNANLGNATFGDTNDTITIPGNLVVTGTQTIQNETVSVVENNTIQFEGATADAHEIKLTAADATTSDKTITLPDLTGHVALFAAAASGTISSTPAELNKLDGATVTTAEINYLDITTLGVSQNSKALTQSAAGKITIGATGADQILDIASHDLVDGGLQLAGTLVTASASEINKLDGLTATTTELNYVDGVTSGIQTQLDAKENSDNKITEKLSGSSATAYTITHNHNSKIVATTVLEYGDDGVGATYEQVMVDVQPASNNAVTITFGTAPGTSQDYLVLMEKFPAVGS